jgi:hypothetical protein
MEDNIVPFCLRLYEVVFDEIVSNDLKVIEKQKALSNELMSVKKFPQPQKTNPYARSKSIRT